MTEIFERLHLALGHLQHHRTAKPPMGSGILRLKKLPEGFFGQCIHQRHFRRRKIYAATGHRQHPNQPAPAVNGKHIPVFKTVAARVHHHPFHSRALRIKLKRLHRFAPAKTALAVPQIANRRVDGRIFALHIKLRPTFRPLPRQHDV